MDDDSIILTEILAFRAAFLLFASRFTAQAEFVENTLRSTGEDQIVAATSGELVVEVGLAMVRLADALSISLASRSG